MTISADLKHIDAATLSLLKQRRQLARRHHKRIWRDVIIGIAALWLIGTILVFFIVLVLVAHP